MDFYNPFHFVPVAKRSETQRGHDIMRTQLTHATHERFLPGRRSGRLLVKLTTVTPVVVGAAQSRPGKKQLAVVEPFELDGKPAIPASTLRGMVGAVVEAASNSAARVLENPLYSYRKLMDPLQTLSAIGLVARNERGALCVRPMALPTLTRNHRSGDYDAPPRFRRIFPVPRFKVYMGKTRNEITNANVPWRTSATQAFNFTVFQLAWNGNAVPDDRSLHCKPNHQNPRFAVAQVADVDEAPMRGYMRVLGCWGDRESQIPAGKKHELWVPEPHPQAPSLPINAEVLAVFHALADERTEDSLKSGGPLLPFHPLDTPRNEDPATLGQNFRLKPGDMVYFEVDAQGKEVTEIALSAIWRGAVKDAAGQQVGTHGFFHAVDPDLVPFAESRDRITIAEQMLGFVENVTDQDKDKDRAALALASRIRFSDGLPEESQTKEQLLEADRVPLRILSSPKLPSPALYFRGRPGQQVAKAALRPGEQTPQGRKMYLHQKSDAGQTPWKTANTVEHPDQKNSVQPIRRGAEFHFHIDFENLSDDELALLVYALSPHPDFHHKVGMGRPLGLGSIKLDVAAYLPVDRVARYSLAGLRADRYVPVTEPLATWLAAQRQRVTESGLVAKEMDQALRLLGDYAKSPVAASVHYPAVEGQVNLEQKLFEWFVANDRASGGQALKPLAGEKALPVLKRNQRV